MPASYTVADAIADHIQYLEHEKKSAEEARYRADAHILPALGKLEVKKLSTKQIEDWRNGVSLDSLREFGRSAASSKTIASWIAMTMKRSAHGAQLSTVASRT